MKKDSHTQSSTQIEMGIDKEHEQYFILPQLETITRIEQGARIIEPSVLFHEEMAMAMAY
jgi:hypothetical protein